MPSKKKKYNARFPAGRIKKIMQSDEEIGKVAQAVPVIISKTLELFVESLLTKTLKITNSRNAKTLSTSHMKQCIMAEQRFDFLRELVKNIPDISVAEEAANYQEEDGQSSPDPDSDTPTDLSMPSTSSQAVRAAAAIAAAAQLNNGAGSVYQRSYSEGGLGAAMHHPAPRQSHRGALKRSEPAADTHSTRRPVIMHTTNVLKAADCLPPKLWRSDSSPAEPQLAAAAAALRVSQRAQRLAEPPSHNHGSREQTAALATPPAPVAAIPAPIVSFDFCNKPVVKIDYSNLPITAGVGGVSAAAAGAASDRNCAAAPVVGEPVINIDLSNLCTAPPLIPAAHQPSASNSSRQSKAAAAAAASAPAVPAISYQIDLTKSLTPAVAVTVATPPAVAASAGSTAKNSFLELDEDYDNI